MSECRPAEGTRENTSHLLFFEDNNDIPWIWRDGGWRGFNKGVIFTPAEMANFGWKYRGPQ